MRILNFTSKLILPAVVGFGVLAMSVQSRADEIDGKAIYEKSCAKCHGADGNGKGRAGRGLKVDPTAFNDKAVMAKITDDEMIDATKLGGGEDFAKKHPDFKSSKSGKALSKEMEAFPKLSDDEIKAVVQYVKTLAK